MLLFDILPSVVSHFRMSVQTSGWHSDRNRGNAAVTAVITTGMGTNQENRAVIPQ